MESVLESVWLYCAKARLIFLYAGFGPDFAAGPQSHAWAAVLALSPAQVRGQSGLARVLPRRNGSVQAVVGAWALAVEFLSGFVGAVVFALLQGS